MEWAHVIKIMKKIQLFNHAQINNLKTQNAYRPVELGENKKIAFQYLQYRKAIFTGADLISINYFGRNKGCPES